MAKKKTTPRRKRSTQKSNLGSVQKDKLSVGGAILSFLFPPVGVYHYFSNKGTNSQKANTALGLAAMGIVGNYVAYANYKEKANEKAIKEFYIDVTSNLPNQ